MSMPAEQVNVHPTLAALLDGFAAAPDIAVHGIAVDSRRLAVGDVFLACQGMTHHGIDFVGAAVESGAAAIVYDASTSPSVPDALEIPVIGIDDLAGKLGEIANRFFATPSARVGVIGVTGTNGKSTVAWLLAQCLTRIGKRCAYAGTLGYGLDTIEQDDGMTSPDVLEMHRRLAGFADAGATHAAIEVSSHALDQRRVDGTQFDAVLFSNLSRDHLDYHGTMQAYGEAKARLFLDYPARCRIVNLDTDFGTELASRCRDNVITVSTRFDRVANGRPFVFVRAVAKTASGCNVNVQSSWGAVRLELPLFGEFNVANAVLVLAYLLCSGVDLDDARDALENVTPPPGRMQRVPGPGPSVFIDYAHTPNALEAALDAIRAHTKGRTWCVFGCGGDRDAGKRALMGRVAERLAGHIVLTNDNPRREAPGAIIEDIVSGLSRPDAATIIEDRAAAIAWAIAGAADNDTVLIAGKGHEDYQILGDERIDFSDYRAAAANLSRRAGGRQ